MAFNGASSSSSFSSSFTHQWAHDVFLSFKGEDTRNNFTAHLHAALLQNGINTYIDNDLKRGENISPALINAIKESRISVIVFSQNYASSSWCLDELATILECKEKNGQIVLPVFYKVDPSDVRHQKKSFKEAFVKHEERFKDNQRKVQRWKEALIEVTNLSGCHLGNRNEHDFIKEIIDWMNSILVKETKFQVAQYQVGIESQVQAVKLLLDIEKKDRTCMVGIFGTGGIGKTTLAEFIFNLIVSQFEGSCFLRDVRETSGPKDGLIHLQNKLLSKIVGGSSPMVDNVNQGVTLIKKRLCLKRILLVLDDVDEPAQLEKLAGNIDWFGLGSKIIITTRNKHLLCAVDLEYEVKLLDHDEALQLFSWNAFNSNKPNDGYEEVTEDVVSYCGGLPLALTVLGSALKGRDIDYWKSKLDEYKRNPDKKIQEILRISYDGLNYIQKDIFLDIACFFKGGKLEEYGFFPYHVIQELVNKSLNSISWFERRLIMHDLLQEVSREIVRQESPEPSERSRLWFHEDVRHVLEDNTGTNNVEGILINFLKPDDQIHFSSQAFEKMKRLRYIINRNAYFSEEPTFLCNELRLIDWFKYPGESFPSNFRGRNLFVLRMCSGHLRELKGLQHFQKLTTMNFSHCNFLEKIPDVSRISNLKSLELDCCENLVEVHHSVGLLDKLVELKVGSCKNLVSFPTSLKLRSLESIYLCGSPRLKNFPKIECKMECLDEISSDYCNMKELSSSICLLLEDDRRSIEKSSISSGTELLQHLPSTNTSDSNDHYFSNVFSKLRSVSLQRCVLSESKFFRAFGCASTLSTLDLSCSDIVSLPRDIESFVGLEKLSLVACRQLKEILGFPPNVEYVDAGGCVSLEIMRLDPPEPVGVEAVYPIHEISGYSGKGLVLDGCMQLREISNLPPRIRGVYLNKCTSLERFPFNNIVNDLPKLNRIDFSNCPEHIGNALQIQLFSEGYHNKFREFLFQMERPLFMNDWNDTDLIVPYWIDRSNYPENIEKDMEFQVSSEGHPRLRFECIYPGNMIPDWFSYRKEVLNTNSCEIDINGLQPFDFKNTIFAFSAVIGFGTEDGQDGHRFYIHVGVINDGQKIYSTSYDFYNIDKSNHVWLRYEVPHSQLKTNNFRVEFTLKVRPSQLNNPLKLVVFKSCGFDLVHRYEEKAVDSLDGIQHSKRLEIQKEAT